MSDMRRSKTLGLCPKPRKLFEKSLKKNLKGNALRAFLGNGIILFILLALTGCQLARDDIGREEARLVGVFITMEYLSMFEDPDPDLYIPFRRGRPDFSVLFQARRIYAEFDEESWQFNFPDVEGIPFFTVNLPPYSDDGPQGHVVATRGGRGIVPSTTRHHFGDNSVSIEMEGTVYAIPGSQAGTGVFINRVFQTTGGDVFLEPGSGFSFHGTMSEGSVFSQTLTETTTITENGVENTNSMSVTVNLATMFAPTGIVILEMDEDSQVVMRTEFAPDKLPETFYPNERTAYLILETHRANPEAHERVLRELVAKEAHGQWLSIFVARDDGILEKNDIRVIWPDG